MSYQQPNQGYYAQPPPQGQYMQGPPPPQQVTSPLPFPIKIRKANSNTRSANLSTIDVLPARPTAASPGREEGQRLPGGLSGDAVLLLAVWRDVRVLSGLSGLLLLSARERTLVAGEQIHDGGRG